MRPPFRHLLKRTGPWLAVLLLPLAAHAQAPANDDPAGAIALPLGTTCTPTSATTTGATTTAPAGLDVQFRVPPGLPDPELAPDLLHHFYLIYKEALHNVVKHAQATTVTVQLADALAGLTLTVADDGRGHDGCPRPGGHGLGNMQARAQAVGGTVRYEPQPAGFAVVVNLPLG